jgi:hypothetical protein
MFPLLPIDSVKWNRIYNSKTIRVVPDIFCKLVKAKHYARYAYGSAGEEKTGAQIQ